MSTVEARLTIRRGGFELHADWTVPLPGVTAVFGRSGTGKTSLLRAIAGLDRHAGGFLRVGGECWQEGRVFVPAHRRRVGFVPQEASLFDHLGVKGNLEYGWRRTPSRERRFDLDSVIGWLDLEPLLARDVATLSGGERQRVAIGRALAASPKLLLLDEPLASLDEPGKRRILGALDTVAREADLPMVYVSHSPDEVARLADRLLLLGDGRVLGAGPIEEMLTRLDLPLARAADAESRIDARVAQIDGRFGLARLEAPMGTLWVPDQGLRTGATVRVRLLARDISIALEPPSRTSILNVFPARVSEIAEEGEGPQATVRLVAGDTPLLARITRRSVHALALEPGMAVYAQVKSVVVLA